MLKVTGAGSKFKCTDCGAVSTEEQVKEATAKYLFNGTADDITSLAELGETVCPNCGVYTSEED